MSTSALALIRPFWSRHRLGLVIVFGCWLFCVAFMLAFPNLTSVRFSLATLGMGAVLPVSLAYLAAVFAFPATFSAKAVGAALGVAVIHLINLVRVCALFLIGLYARQFFHDTHVYVAQALVVAAAVALWLYWVGRFAHAPGR